MAHFKIKRRKNMKRKLIALICILALMLPMAVMPTLAASTTSNYMSPLVDASTPSDVDYSFAVIGDLQSMSWSDNKYGTTYTKSIGDWLIDNRKTRDIEYVFGLGDTVDTLISYPEGYNPTVNNPKEWNVAVTNIFKPLADNEIPYSVVRGNHDDVPGYNSYIAKDYYRAQMDGFYSDSDNDSKSNSFRKIVANGQKYLMLALDYEASDSVIEWANEVIAANPDHRVIASIHVYLDGYSSTTKPAYLSTANDGFFEANVPYEYDESQTNNYWYYSFSGKKLWNNLFSKHENMFMVLCGHDALPNPVINTRTGNNGNKVLELLVDTSKYDLEYTNSYGGGFMMLLNIRENSDSVEVEMEYFSPYIATENHMDLDISSASATVTKTFTGLPTVDISLPQTNQTASVRISTKNNGLRFKTNIIKETIDNLINTYGAENVGVGTLIAPTDTLGGAALTHKVATPFVDVKATVDQPFADDGTTLTYAGSLSKIKLENLDRDFTAVGYISYKDGSGNTHYIYSDSSCTRSINYVATAALNDNSAGYTLAQLAIIEQLTLKYHQDIVKDPFGKDPF